MKKIKGYQQEFLAIKTHCSEKNNLEGFETLETFKITDKLQQRIKVFWDSLSIFEQLRIFSTGLQKSLCLLSSAMKKLAKTYDWAKNHSQNFYEKKLVKRMYFHTGKVPGTGGKICATQMFCKGVNTAKEAGSFFFVTPVEEGSEATDDGESKKFEDLLELDRKVEHGEALVKNKHSLERVYQLIKTEFRDADLKFLESGIFVGDFSSETVWGAFLYMNCRTLCSKNSRLIPRDRYDLFVEGVQSKFNALIHKIGKTNLLTDMWLCNLRITMFSALFENNVVYEFLRQSNPIPRLISNKCPKKDLKKNFVVLTTSGQRMMKGHDRLLYIDLKNPNSPKNPKKSIMNMKKATKANIEEAPKLDTHSPQFRPEKQPRRNPVVSPPPAYTEDCSLVLSFIPPEPTYGFQPKHLMQKDCQWRDYVLNQYSIFDLISSPLEMRLMLEFKSISQQPKLDAGLKEKLNQRGLPLDYYYKKSTKDESEITTSENPKNSSFDSYYSQPSYYSSEKSCQSFQSELASENHYGRTHTVVDPSSAKKKKKRKRRRKKKNPGKEPEIQLNCGISSVDSTDFDDLIECNLILNSNSNQNNRKKSRFLAKSQLLNNDCLPPRLSRIRRR